MVGSSDAAAGAAAMELIRYLPPPSLTFESGCSSSLIRSPHACTCHFGQVSRRGGPQEEEGGDRHHDAPARLPGTAGVHGHREVPRIEHLHPGEQPPGIPTRNHPNPRHVIMTCSSGVVIDLDVKGEVRTGCLRSNRSESEIL